MTAGTGDPVAGYNYDIESLLMFETVVKSETMFKSRTMSDQSFGQTQVRRVGSDNKTGSGFVQRDVLVRTISEGWQFVGVYPPFEKDLRH